MLIILEFREDPKALYNLLYPIYKVGGFDMELDSDRLVVKISSENSIRARQILNSILRLTSTAEEIMNKL
ncbi:MAG: hypothetical protein QW336_02920, partial [Candidatus Anstonellales archaeon]